MKRTSLLPLFSSSCRRECTYPRRISLKVFDKYFVELGDNGLRKIAGEVRRWGDSNTQHKGVSLTHSAQVRNRACDPSHK